MSEMYGVVEAIFSHLTLIFLNKLMMFGVVHQVYGVVSPDSVILVGFLMIQLSVNGGNEAEVMLAVSSQCPPLMSSN